MQRGDQATTAGPNGNMDLGTDERQPGDVAQGKAALAAGHSTAFGRSLDADSTGRRGCHEGAARTQWAHENLQLPTQLPRGGGMAAVPAAITEHTGMPTTHAVLVIVAVVVSVCSVCGCVVGVSCVGGMCGGHASVLCDCGWDCGHSPTSRQ